MNDFFTWVTNWDALTSTPLTNPLFWAFTLSGFVIGCRKAWIEWRHDKNQADRD